MTPDTREIIVLRHPSRHTAQDANRLLPFFLLVEAAAARSEDYYASFKNYENCLILCRFSVSSAKASDSSQAPKASKNHKKNFSASLQDFSFSCCFAFR
jgi:hypothetical protein